MNNGVTAIYHNGQYNYVYGMNANIPDWLQSRSIPDKASYLFTRTVGINHHPHPLKAT